MGYTSFSHTIKINITIISDSLWTGGSGSGLGTIFSRDVSDLCAIRGQRSDVMKIVYHMTQVFLLLLHSHHSEFVGTI